MSRYIDADALWMDVIHAMDYADDFLKMIEDAPTANVRENVHGEWIKITHKGTVFTDSKCSNCGKTYALYPLGYNFCPNCSADMRGKS